MVGDSKYGTFDHIFWPLSILSPKSQILLYNCFFGWNTLFPSSHMHNLLNKFFYITWVRGVAYQKQLSGPKLMGPGLGEHVKMWDPYLFLLPLKLATPNLVYNLGLPRNNFYDQNWRGSGLGEYPKKFGTPYLFLQPLKLATSNLVYNLGLGSSLPRNNFYD